MVQANYGYARVLETDTSHEPLTRVKRVRRTVKKVNNQKPLMIKCSMAVFLIALTIVYLCIKSSTLGYQIVSLENDIGKLEAAKQQMEYQIAEKSSLSRIETVATRELGMYRSEKDSSFTVLLASKSEPVKAVAVEKSNSEGKPLVKIYASLTRLAVRNN